MRKQKIEPYSDAEAYAVCAAATPLVYESSKPETIVFQQETETYHARDAEGGPKGDNAFQTAWGATIQAFVRENRTSRLLQRVFPTDEEYVVLSSATVKALA